MVWNFLNYILNIIPKVSGTRFDICDLIIGA